MLLRKFPQPTFPAVARSVWAIGSPEKTDTSPGPASHYRFEIAVAPYREATVGRDRALFVGARRLTIPSHKGRAAFIIHGGDRIGRRHSRTVARV